MNHPIVQPGADLLTEFQKDKFRHFFFHVLDLNSDCVISAEDFEKLNEVSPQPPICRNRWVKARLHILFMHEFSALSCVLQVLTFVHLCLWKQTLLLQKRNVIRTTHA